MAQITKTYLIDTYIKKIRELVKQFGLIEPDQSAPDQINIYLDLIEEQIKKKPKQKYNQFTPGQNDY